ncbi:MAG TPA: hypothetical protein VFO39_19240 [Candidatus Sulfotelmatobacter sp.]|nr:hypothetical protein [Candidatus Sulfotelmatobacter sp.]
MRATLTLEDDVAAALERVRRTTKASFKALVNDALRRGLKEISRPAKSRKPFTTASANLGRLRIASIDNVQEALAVAEGEGFR